jgi:HPt (histidine-containing phosphotransfer) domain-containing protein
MKSRPWISYVPLLSSDALVVMVFSLGIAFVAAGIIPLTELTSGLIEGASSLRSVAERQHDIALANASLDTLRERLTDRADLQEPIEQIRTLGEQLGTTLPALTAPRAAHWFALSGDTGATMAPVAGAHAPRLAQLWEHARADIGALAALKDQAATTGTEVSDALRLTRRDLRQLDTELGTIASDLQANSGRQARDLRLLLFIGLFAGASLTAVVVVLMGARRLQDASLREARQQTVDILRTVKDGLFLIDRDLKVGATYSAAMQQLFQRKDIAGLDFESLLRDIVSEKTLLTALKYVKVLWLDRTNEKLVRSINPLGEVEIHLDTGDGKFDTHFLQFEFHRVRADGQISHLLVAVSDVTPRVELARELQNSQSKAQAQLDTLLGILHIDPVQLSSFLSDSNAAMKMINSVLREPARDENAFRNKLDTLFRQAHSVKGEAAALGLSSIESRAHSFEDDLRALREKTGLSGNDFLPLVLKLDDLMTHLQSINDVVTRLSKLQSGGSSETVYAPLPSIPELPPARIAAASAAAPVPAASTASRPSTASTASSASSASASATHPIGNAGLPAALQQLATRIAGELHKQVYVQCIGFEEVPEEYRRVVKDVAIQAVRNAVVHGIEPTDIRQAAGKTPQGLVRLSFRSLGDEGYKLSAEDDGRGLALGRIKQVAVQRGLITPEQALTLQPKQMYALLFQPGFSTAESVTRDAGRGVGMNMIADLMHQIGGRVGIATAEGRYTRIAVTFPPHAKAGSTATAAA